MLYSPTIMRALNGPKRSAFIVHRVTQKWVLFCLLPSMAVAQMNTTAVNRWRIHGWLDGSDLEAQCTLTQRGHALKGACTTEQGTSDVTGQSDGATISWSYDADIGGVLTTLRYSGTLSGRNITGKISASDNPNAGAFRAELIR